jgi:hypothetical protein
MVGYKTDITFQYLAPGASRPDDVTLTDVKTELGPGAQVPAVGDIVTLQRASPRSPDEQHGSWRSFKGVGRNFAYGNEIVEGETGIAGIGGILGSTIFVIVTDPQGDEVGLDIKE